MKISYFILSSLICFLNLQYSNAEEIVDKTTAIHGQTADQSLLVLLKVPGVKEQYDICKSNLDAQKNEDPKKLPECVWNGLSDDIKKNVQSALKKTQTVEGQSKQDLTLTSPVMTSTYSNDPGYKKLSDLIATKLHKAMNGDETDKSKVASVDHAKYNELYKSEISKSIVDTLTTYCLKVDYATPTINSACTAEKKCNGDTKCEAKCTFYSYLDFKDKDNTDKNIADLNQSSQTFGDKIDKCMGSVPAACSSSNNNEKSRQDACTVDNFLRSSRKNLILTEQLTKFYDTEVKSGNSLQLTNLREQNSLNTAEALTVTSKEVEGAFKDVNIKLSKEASDCEQAPNQANCKKFLDTNISEKEKSLTEFGLRQYAQEESLNIITDQNNKDGIKEYLKKEGYTDAEINALVADDTQMNTVKDKIKEKFKVQRESLMNELSDRIKGSTVQAINPNNDITKYRTISGELAAKTDNLKQLVRFNNITSAYLVVTDAKGGRNPANAKTTNNSESLKLELKSSDKNDPANLNIKNNTKLNSQNKDNGIINLKLSDLSDILGY